jgi:hypothetical protein
MIAIGPMSTRILNLLMQQAALRYKLIVEFLLTFVQDWLYDIATEDSLWTPPSAAAAGT